MNDAGNFQSGAACFKEQPLPVLDWIGRIDLVGWNVPQIGKLTVEPVKTATSLGLQSRG